mmetsp:Transcript_25314/g.44239  ORF Transcript_25314/g.44239 Transcript_25314/m.44239 type:complete len:628 (-) Transcript_25314:170-2053(-)
MTELSTESTLGNLPVLENPQDCTKSIVSLSVEQTSGNTAEVSCNQQTSQCKAAALKESTPEVIKAAETSKLPALLQHEVIHVAPIPGSGEDFLLDMLTRMDQHLWCMREVQQRLVHTIELACRTALGKRFGKLTLVGSVALSVQTPGSDVDVVCFTQRIPDEAPGLPVDHLRKVLETLTAMTRHCRDFGTDFSMELIDDARVPILRVVWGPPEHATAADLLIDQQRPVDHVRWFQRMHAAPRDTVPSPSVTPLVTVTLRSVKWWLRQRQIPRTKEGGLPTIVWLLMALHTCSQPETHKVINAIAPAQMAALLASLTAFFNAWAGLDGLHGSLEFGAETDGLVSEFRHRPKKKHFPWPELSVLDPTMPNVASSTSSDLVPALSPATRLLLIYELSRAKNRLPQSAQGSQNSACIMCHDMEEVFAPTWVGRNLLPSMVPHGAGCVALFLQGDPTKGVGIIELGIIDQIVPRPGWAADFLHRSDTSSELHARTCEVDEQTGHCRARREGHVVLCPCHFICLAYLKQDNYRLVLDPESLMRFNSMKAILVGLHTHERALEETQQNEIHEKPKIAGEGACGEAAPSDLVPSKRSPRSAGRKGRRGSKGRRGKKDASRPGNRTGTPEEEIPAG